MFKSLHSPEYQRLITWLKEQRKSQGLTMREVGDALGTHHQFIGKIEQCERRLDVAEYVKYCHALGVTPSDGIALIEDELSS